MQVFSKRDSRLLSGFAAGCAVMCSLLGCGSDPTMGPPVITLEYPPDLGDQAASQAAAQCTPYGKTAKPKGLETHNGVQVLVFECS